MFECDSDYPTRKTGSNRPATPDGYSIPTESTSGRGNGYSVDGEYESTENLSESVIAALDMLSLDNSRRKAVRAMYEYLHENRTADESDFIDEVYPEYPAGYQSSKKWWNALGKDALEELPGAKEPTERDPQWRFVREE